VDFAQGAGEGGDFAGRLAFLRRDGQEVCLAVGLGWNDFMNEPDLFIVQ